MEGIRYSVLRGLEKKKGDALPWLLRCFDMLLLVEWDFSDYPQMIIIGIGKEDG